MVVSLKTMRVWLFIFNSQNTPWNVRAIMFYMSTVWFAYFNTSGSNIMIPNKRNMMFETIEIIFLVTRRDVSQPMHFTSKANEHTYVRWRNNSSKFIKKKIICIHDKTKIRNYSIFENGIVTSLSSTTRKGYQQTIFKSIDSFFLSFLLIWLPWPDSMLVIGWFFQAQNSSYPVTKLCP